MLTKKLTIFYFSGTGNSLNVAKWMSSVASNKNLECNIFDISFFDKKSIKEISADSLIVFISPVHGFNYPPVMLNFIARFPKGKNKVILMNTRAGMLIGKYNLPGLSGATFLWSSLILKIKGYSIIGTKPVDLPSNWMSLHPSLNEKAIKKLHERHKAKVFDFGEKIFSGKKSFVPLYELIIDLIIAPISIGYYLVGRFLFAKTFYTSSDCNDCDLCITKCPVKAIIKIDNRPFWTFKCESCMRCMSNCPKRSIETAHGFILTYCLFASIMTGLFFNYFNRWTLFISNGLTHYIVETALFLLFLGLIYRIVHFLMRFKLFERLMVYTSLTKYKFWGKRYKALKDF
ncbi:MAG TPA: EFR1 family ferrodoxin [Bacteroidales bacterium]|nr:EFR1 family ferrodoxin [Bacteroidales bacterium]